jgi:hypothetical protein
MALTRMYKATFGFVVKHFSSECFDNLTTWAAGGYLTGKENFLFFYHCAHETLSDESDYQLKTNF